MQNIELKPQIEWAMRRVPRLGRGWKYVPLFEMPPEVEILIDVKHALEPLEPRLINNANEINVLKLPEGRYSLKMGVWPCVTFSTAEGHTVESRLFHAGPASVRPHHPILAPTSIFEANVDLPNFEKNDTEEPNTVTWRLTTGYIRGILIPGTRFKLKDEDKNDADRLRDKRWRVMGKRKLAGSYRPLRSRFRKS